MNAAFTGGGVSSVVGLGAFARLNYDRELTINSFSGTSIGAVIAVCLAAGKDVYQLLRFLKNNVEDFCKPITGKGTIETRLDEFLDGIRFCDLPKECIVSITPLSRGAPRIVTRENAGELTVARVATLSATFIPLFLPSVETIGGKKMIVLDGGLSENPPLKENDFNYLFTFLRKGKEETSQLKQMSEEKPTETKTTGKSSDVVAAFEEGYTGVYAALEAFYHEKYNKL